MNCLYYLAPTLDSTHQVTDDLHTAGVRDFFIHVISKDEHGLGEHHLHSSNYLETLDIVREVIRKYYALITQGIIDRWEAVPQFNTIRPFELPWVTDPEAVKRGIPALMQLCPCSLAECLGLSRRRTDRKSLTAWQRPCGCTGEGWFRNGAQQRATRGGVPGRSRHISPVPAAGRRW